MFHNSAKKKQQIELLNQNTNWAAHFRTIFAKFCKCQWRRRVPGLEEGRSERKQRFGLGASLHARHDTRCQQTLAEHSGPVTGPGLPLVPLRPSFFLPTPVGALSWCTCSCPPPPGWTFGTQCQCPPGQANFPFKNGQFRAPGAVGVGGLQYHHPDPLWGVEMPPTPLSANSTPHVRLSLIEACLGHHRQAFSGLVVQGIE